MYRAEGRTKKHGQCNFCTCIARCCTVIMFTESIYDDLKNAVRFVCIIIILFLLSRSLFIFRINWKLRSAQVWLCIGQGKFLILPLNSREKNRCCAGYCVGKWLACVIVMLDAVGCCRCCGQNETWTKKQRVVEQDSALCSSHRSGLSSWAYSIASVWSSLTQSKSLLLIYRWRCRMFTSTAIRIGAASYANTWAKRQKNLLDKIHKYKQYERKTIPNDREKTEPVCWPL